MSDALGLAIGTTNLVAARPGRQPVTRRAVLTLWDGRPAEVGVPSQNPELTSPNLTEAGLIIRGFVERVGDPVPLVAADGSTHRGEDLLVSALEAMARAVDDGAAPSAVTIAVPAHWGPAAVEALRGALRAAPSLSPAGVPPEIVSEATAALVALQTQPGFPTSGVVALCDFGGSGSSVSLADAGAGLAPIGETVRFAAFSGDQVDQAILNRVLAEARAAGHLDPAGTAPIGGLTRLRGECRMAKERLSSVTSTVVPVDLPGYRSEMQITRAELEGLIAEPVGGFLDVLGDALEHNRIPAAALSAVATVGGGAAIPALAQLLAEALRIPVVSTPSPASTAAVGSAILASRGIAPDAPTGLAVTAAEMPTSLAPTAWAAGAAGAAATESASDGSPSATYRALAWSQDDEAGSEPVPYVGDDYYPPPDYHGASPTGERSAVEFGPGDFGPGDFGQGDTATVLVAPPLPWYRRPPLLFGIAATVAAVAVGGLAVTLTSSDSTPTTTTTRVTKPGEPPTTSAVAVPQTITVTGSNGEPTVTTVTPSPSTTTASSSATTTTTTPTTTTTTTTPTTTTTTTPTTTTTTTTTPTTTRTTTTTTAPPTTTTAPPTTSTAAPPTTTAAPITTTVAPPPTTQAVITTEPLPTLKPAPVEPESE